ncbi:hypothetical protein NitYY0826_C1493 [Nitratiruptor sp. YY08-26]|uniref:DUF72 domain-containing protein n=1 Tax=unclassified Nitratiruptor TaxID=2624044 RepID=UPI001916C590|nr:MULTISPECIES: DUF72 domain-containing protein [unclassified Nitratiruptor]BCD62611.1 hypothetical protein NitYY0813_C1491 [Nitratiruptor sp. YY08-13]BCD66547.1 hypothetical protein NitYY0826_C1493 [Nitratiruptor sp. YY08-26]
MSAKAYIGTSGFYYEHWKGIFYPQDLPKKEYLRYYMEHFNTVEMNATFYHLPKAKTIEHWLQVAKEGFYYCIKAYRGITHYKKLKDAKDEIYRFLHLIKPLKPHLGVILFQLPPSLHKDLDLLASFLHILPPSYRYAIEFRHNSWYEEDIYELLRRYNVAFCIHDFGKKSTPMQKTANFVYIRLHGTNGRYVGSYDDETLLEWAKRIEGFLQTNSDVFAYFNNDFGGDAVKDAKRLLSFLHAE